MTDPFRDQHHKCPSCNEELREFRGRWACDACGGVLMNLEDLASGIYDMTSIQPGLTFVDERAGTRACPICDAPMSECRIRIQLEDEHAKPKTKSDPKLDRCAAHGLWFDDEELGAVLATVSGKGYGSASPVITKSNGKVERGPRQMWFKIGGRGWSS